MTRLPCYLTKAKLRDLHPIPQWPPPPPPALTNVTACVVASWAGFKVELELERLLKLTHSVIWIWTSTDLSRPKEPPPPAPTHPCPFCLYPVSIPPLIRSLRIQEDNLGVTHTYHDVYQCEITKVLLTDFSLLHTIISEIYDPYYYHSTCTETSQLTQYILC